MIRTISGLAEALAREAHGNTPDKAGRPYIEHPERVARSLMTRSHGEWVSGRPGEELDVAAAWLHDVPEDTDFGLVRLKYEGERVLSPGQQFDWEQVVNAVRHLTHHKWESREDYYAKVRECERAVRVKLADIADNSDPVRLALLPDEKIVYFVKKYARAKEAIS